MIERSRYVALALIFWAVTPGLSQPSTDIHLAELGPAGEVRVETLRNVTARDGYDNQPQFLPDGGAFLYTSIREDGQADTYRYDLADGTIVRVTDTPESEYSPTPMPGGDAFSAVRVEADSAQRLWSFARDGGTERLLLPDIEPVGYHAWGDSATVVLYVLGSPATLHVARPGSPGSRTVAEGVGRSLQRVPGRPAVSFVQVEGEGSCRIMELDLRTVRARPLISCRPGGEDHAWTSDGIILMGSGSTLHAWKEGDEGWRQLADLGPHGVGDITRLAVSPGGTHLAIVGARD